MVRKLYSNKAVREKCTERPRRQDRHTQLKQYARGMSRGPSATLLQAPNLYEAPLAKYSNLSLTYRSATASAR